jgi:hypothetical protein
VPSDDSGLSVAAISRVLNAVPTVRLISKETQNQMIEVLVPG